MQSQSCRFNLQLYGPRYRNLIRLERYISGRPIDLQPFVIVNTVKVYQEIPDLGEGYIRRIKRLRL